MIFINVVFNQTIYFSIHFIKKYLLVKAIYNEQVIAESDNTVVIEGNHYFPRNSVKENFLVMSDTHTTCPWKGVAYYYHVVVNGEKAEDAAWFYPHPKTLAESIKGYIAFWHGVKVLK